MNYTLQGYIDCERHREFQNKLDKQCELGAAASTENFARNSTSNASWERIPNWISNFTGNARLC